MTDHKALKAIIKKFKKEDSQLIGISVFNVKTGKVLATTAPMNIAKKVVWVRQQYEKMGHVVDKKYPAGKWNWSMTSLSRLIGVGVRIKGDLSLTVAYKVEKAPSAAIEDALELALMVNDEL